jgi:luciferase family oxidoreductase group 1
VDEQIAELFAFARHEFPNGHPYATVDATPNDGVVPPIWMLGSTRGGAAIAAALGVGFAFAGHFNMAQAAGAIALYRSRFQPTPSMAAPQLIMAVSVVCGEDDAHARDLAAPLRVAFARLASGKPGPFPSIEEARAHHFSPAELEAVERFAEGAIVGGPARVRDGLERLAVQSGADEIMVSTVVPIPGERIASYERVARLWGLASTDSP